MDDRKSNIPFTPPPHYVHTKDLPRRREPEVQRSIEYNNGGESSVYRKQSIARRVSNRVQKNTRQKRKPGLSIDTTVTRHKAKPPQEIKNPPSQVTAIALATSPQPWQTTQQAAYQPNEQSFGIPPPLNSPSKFPASFVHASKRDTLRASPGPKDLYFAPPPGTLSKRSSSVYSKATRSSSIREDMSRKKSLKQKLFNGPSTRRSSNATTFEEDTYQERRNRVASGGTMFEEDMSARAPSTAYTITPHRSRGWWTLITTPFESKPGMALEYRSPNEGDKTPAVPLIPKEYQDVNAMRLSRNKNHVSTWSAFSPDDRDIPIMLDGSLQRQDSVESQNDRNQYLSPNTAGSVVNRMPFADMGKTPPSGLDEFSPAGMVAGQGSVGGTHTVVNINMVAGPMQAQSTEVFCVEEPNVPQNKRASIREAMSRTVRFITPHPSGVQIVPETTLQSQASDDGYQVREVYNNAPQTPKQVRFASFNMNRDFSPPPVASKGSSVDYEEFEIDDKPPNKKKKQKKDWSGLLSFLTGGKKGKKDKNGDDQKKEKKKMSKRRKICCMCCFCFLVTGLLILILIITLAVTMSKKHRGGSSTQIIWTNITGFPGIPAGVLTIARPNLIANVSGCVSPQTAWSCAVPKEQQAAIAPNDPFQPNFLIDIFYDNGTNVPVTNKRSTSGAAMANFLLNKRGKFTPSPGAPALAEQTYLGQTTDNNTAPFEGESTPFYISMVQPGSAVPAQLPSKVKRDSQSTASANSFPDLRDLIPPAAMNPDGTPQPANLVPFPSFQPVRLYNRGRTDEHYGFYTFYDRKIFLRSNVVTFSSESIPADAMGGSTQTGANVQCTWSATRFLVQIWTKKGTLLSKASSGSKIVGGNYAQPGSFPYPVTVTIDRHGGVDTVKSLYCYGIGVNGKVNTTAKQFQIEDRSFGGRLLDLSPGVFGKPNASQPIDGGSGGCSCSWQNWT